MNKQLENLKLIEEIRSKKKYNKVICPNCAGTGYGGDTLPISECEECGGKRFIIIEEEKC